MHPIRALHARTREMPVLTHIDATLGSRIELSAATLLNNVAKTAHLLTIDASVEPGDEVLINIPAHWQTATWICAAWSVGALPIFQSATPSKVAKVAITTVNTPVTAEETYVTGLHPFGLPVSGPLPSATTDWSVAMRTFPDFFMPSDLRDVEFSHDQRVVSHVPVVLVSDDSSRLCSALADVLANDASLVLITGAGDNSVDDLLAQERATVVL